MFTDDEKTDIRHCLGFPQVFRYANPRLESALDVVGNDASASAKARAILAKLAVALAAVNGQALPSAGLKSLDKGDVEFQDNHGSTGAVTADVRSIGRQFCNELSILFGVPLANNIFGTGGYQGDWWKLQNGRVSLCGLG